jgi:uncharacterized membrane protein YidH (DUF202 family)
VSSPSDAGLQAERTGLAWSRTSLGIAANAVLLAVREINPLTSPIALAPAALALMIAAGTAIYGRRRTARLRHSPFPRPLAARAAVHLLGIAVVLLAVLSGLTMITGSLID